MGSHLAEENRHLPEAIEAELPICDPHFHLMDNMLAQYLIGDLITDVNSGHNVRQMIYMECGNGYRNSGPETLRPVGEVEYVVAQGAPDGLISGIVAFADLRLGDGVQEVLEALQAAGDSRVRGIRFGASWDPDPAFCFERHKPAPGVLRDPILQRGAAAVGRLGWPIDCFLFSHQLSDLVKLAQALPDQLFVLDHLGTPLIGSGRQSNPHEVLANWRRDMRAVANCGNVMLKLGGIGMEMQGAPWAPAVAARGTMARRTSEGWDRGMPNRTPPSADDVADHWRSNITFCIDTFGPNRCMFESNFPIDRQTVDYTTLWNAFKLITVGYSPGDRNALFYDTAVRTYGLTARPV